MYDFNIDIFLIFQSNSHHKSLCPFSLNALYITWFSDSVFTACWTVQYSQIPQASPSDWIHSQCSNWRNWMWITAKSLGHYSSTRPEDQHYSFLTLASVAALIPAQILVLSLQGIAIKEQTTQFIVNSMLELRKKTWQEVLLCAVERGGKRMFTYQLQMRWKCT